MRQRAGVAGSGARAVPDLSSVRRLHSHWRRSAAWSLERGLARPGRASAARSARGGGRPPSRHPLLDVSLASSSRAAGYKRASNSRTRRDHMSISPTTRHGLRSFTPVSVIIVSVSWPRTPALRTCRAQTAWVSCSVPSFCCRWPPYETK
jgi:hypothetical protein